MTIIHGNPRRILSMQRLPETTFRSKVSVKYTGCGILQLVNYRNSEICVTIGRVRRTADNLI